MNLADTEGHADPKRGFAQPGFGRFQCPAAFLGHDACGGELGFGEQDNYFLSAPARKRALAAYAVAQDGRHRLEYGVAGIMAMVVVDVLVQIDIAQHDGKRPSIALHTLHLGRRGFKERAAVRESGQGVGARKQGQLGIGPGQACRPLTHQVLQMARARIQAPDAYCIDAEQRQQEGHDHECPEPGVSKGKVTVLKP